jgi:hypothetical protein
MRLQRNVSLSACTRTDPGERAMIMQALW